MGFCTQYFGFYKGDVLFTPNIASVPQKLGAASLSQGKLIDVHTKWGK